MIDSFALEPRAMTPADIPLLHELSVAVGWMHRAEDWATALRLGSGIFLTDEIGRPFGSAMWFPVADDLAMLGMVITTPRLQERGAARWMMDQILAQTGKRDLGLNATRAAFRLYLSMGFQPGLTVWQHQGIVTDSPAADPRVRPMRADDFDAIHALDTRAYTAHREKALNLFLEHSTGTVIEEAGRVTGYALCRRFGRGHVVGPIVAATARDAAAVTGPHLATHRGRYLRIDTRETEGDFVDLLNASGLAARDTVTTMTLGNPRPVDPDAHVFALAIQAIG
ncbi:N-acetyltransferase [Paracoccus sp. R86501]|uniref:N-acetyltransferase n=1 Tax=Paracoccus sp. R86501 TaxID=3101711 RepID=UPI00366F481F